MPRRFPISNRTVLLLPTAIIAHLVEQITASMWSNATLRAITNPSTRTKRLATSTAFAATFAAAILTVSLSASTILPCPANARSKSRGTLADNDDESFSKDAQVAVSMPVNGVGQRILLTRKGGWIEVDQPPHPNQSTSAS